MGLKKLSSLERTAAAESDAVTRTCHSVQHVARHDISVSHKKYVTFWRAKKFRGNVFFGSVGFFLVRRGGGEQVGCASGSGSACWKTMLAHQCERVASRVQRVVVAASTAEHGPDPQLWQ